MANRYWVGGSGNWDDSNTTNWSATSGGAGGESVPTSSDDVFFDTGSHNDSYTVTISATDDVSICKNLTITRPTSTQTVTMSGLRYITVCGDLTINSSLGIKFGSYIYFKGNGVTQNVTTNGGELSIVRVVGTNNVVKLLDNLSVNALFVTTGEFDANNKNLTLRGYLSSSGTGTRSIKMGSGTWTFSATIFNVIQMSTTTNLTFDKGTSLCKFTGNITGDREIQNNVDLYNVEFTSNVNYAYLFRYGRTYNSIKIGAGCKAKFYRGVTHTATTWDIVGTSGSVITLGSDTTSTATLAKAGGGTVTIDYCDVSYITGTPSDTWYATNSTDSGNNSGIDFDEEPAKVLESIAVTTPPTKTTYKAGENFSTTGMVVTATYDDDSTGVVTTYTVTNGTGLTAGQSTVTLSYTEGGVTKTTTQAITVVANTTNFFQFI